MAETSPPPPTPKASVKILPTDSDPAPPLTGWQRLIPISLKHTRTGTRVHVAWRQALVTLIVLTLVAWLGAACSAYLFVKYNRQFTDVKFTHMLLMPWRLDEYREARGEFLIRLGKDELKEQKYREAFYSLRVGISLSPKNREGRMLLAQFYVAWQRPDLARRILLDGLDFNKDDTEYLKALFTYLLQQQSDFELVNITNSLLSLAGPAPVIDERIRLIATAKTTALFFRGNYDEAEDTLKQFRLNDAPDGKLLLLQIEWERGEQNLVLEQLAALTTQFPTYEQIYTQYAAYLREAGREDELRRLCILRQIRFPDRPRPRIDLLYLLDKTKGQEERVNNDIEAIFTDYPKNEELLLALADFAANTGRPALALRIYNHCKANRLSWEGPALMTVEAHIVARDYQSAIVAARQMIKDNPEWGKRFSSVFNGLQAIANFGMDDTSSAQIFLNNFLNQSGVRADNLVAVSNRLMSVGAKNQARQVLDQAVRSDPLNQSALAGLIKLDIEIGNADEVALNVRTLLAMRKPPRAVLSAAYKNLGSDHNLFAPGRTALLDDLQKTISASVERYRAF
jgi:Tfp pilus assembly protein PilF